MSYNKLTIKELIEHLSQFPKDMRIGRCGHFGEFNAMDKSDFYTKKVIYSSKGLDDGEEGNTVLHISPPDIGLEPW